MSMMLDRLRRFRPVGAPGGAGAVGVPVDARSGPPAELKPVFEALDPVIVECDRIRRQAERDAADLTAGADREAAGLVADARSRVAAERADAAAAIRLRGDAAAERVRTAADAEVERLIEHGRQQLDMLVGMVLDNLREEATADRTGVV
ncbi:MAG TPA: hypothetical protein VFT31_08370 [Kribbella sp.]|nr:hypothetical protein [Kribbella sp.]